MSEPPRPPGDGQSGPGPDPTAPLPPTPPSSGEPGSGYAPPPSAPQYPPPGAPPTSPPPAGGGYGPPAGGGYDQPPPGGYAQPPGGGYVPPGGYQPGYQNAGLGGGDDKMFAMIAHFGGAAGGFISAGVLSFVGPLIAYLAKGQQPGPVREHAVAALNFQLLWSIIAAVGYVLGICGSLIIVGAIFFLVPIAAVIIQVIFGIIAGLKANEGQVYRYPMSARFIK